MLENLLCQVILAAFSYSHALRPREVDAVVMHNFLHLDHYVASGCP